MNFIFDNFFFPTKFDESFFFQKVELQLNKPSRDVKIGNLHGLKSGSNVLLDNFLNIVDGMNLKCDMYAIQDCR